MMKISSPDYDDIAYGPHPRHRLDVWKAAEGVTPLVVFIHGGGWKNGDKREQLNKPYARPATQKLLNAGISLASINYRYTSAEHPVPSSQMDAVRAVQFLRYKSSAWGFDKTRIAAFGGSAGGCSALFLAFHDDFANPQSDDPIDHESSRVAAVATVNAQSSIYPKHLDAWIGRKALEHKMIYAAFGGDSVADALDATHEQAYWDASPITHVNTSAPPTFLNYSYESGKVPSDDVRHAIHHRVFGAELQKAMHALGLVCWLQVGERGDTDCPQYQDYADFLIDELCALDK